MANYIAKKQQKGKAGPTPVLSRFHDFPTYHRDHIEVEFYLDEWHDVYLEEEDITGYRAAMRLLGSWKEWERMMHNSTVLSDIVAEWNDEIRMKIKSRAIQKVVELADRNDSIGASAAKWLAEEGWTRTRAGRPTKAQAQAEAKRLAHAANETTEELDRVKNVLSIVPKAEGE